MGNCANLHSKENLIGNLTHSTETKKEGKDEIVEDTNENTAFEISEALLKDPVNLRRKLMDPVPKSSGMLQCYIKRNKGIKNRLCPEYRLYLKSSDTFLMTSKKRANKKTSNYLISIGRNDFDKNSSNIIGKLRSNFLGTEYQIFDSGRNPHQLDPFFDEKNDNNIRSELGSILYASNIMGNKGPRKMHVCINKIDEEGNQSKVCTLDQNSK